MSNNRLRHPLTAVAGALLMTVPWLLLHGFRMKGVFNLWPGLIPGLKATEETALGELGLIIVVAGIAILGASFLLAWAAETAEEDVPRAFALAVLAILAVAPEYAVDALYAWEAGANPGSNAGNLAVANMTGANRILIGLGWSGIALFTVYKVAKTSDPAVEEHRGFLADRIRLDRDISTEIFFLFVATVYAFFVPLNGGIGILDTIFLVGLYVVYILSALNAPHTDEEQVGIPAYLQSFSKLRRVATVLALFVFSGVVILVAVEPFAHGLEYSGTSIGISSFLMIQWVAPLASESPELIVVAYLVNKARSTAGFNALISSKLNQWTLLIGTLAIVYSISFGSIATLQFNAEQSGEIWLTAAQSYFALTILMSFDISMREAVALLVLFVSQVVIAFAIDAGVLGLDLLFTLHAFTALYLVLGTALLIYRRAALVELVGLTRQQVFGDGVHAEPDPEVQPTED
ncbi:sodium:calcium antiporter [Haloarchaeobius litoreus]|uniref:Sodium:calcium antiporter n=1 Tax=Haloarchaeobius litoreus TaxID=755306 RepID=A0ABD6DEF5_9EURY|nr:sodium:calcium antiporter [Haloarchaeobius litoreus]